MLPPVLRLRAAATAVTVVAMLAACSGSGDDELDVEGFAPGACTEIAPALEDVDEALRRLDAEDLTPREAADRLKTAQDALKPKGGEAAGVEQDVRALVTSIGFLRISVDTNGYDGSQAADVRDALEQLADTCREG